MTTYVLEAVKFFDFSNLSRWVYKQVTAYESWKDARQTYKELSRLSDRELHDIGIGRSDIRSIANQTWHDEAKTNKNLEGWV